MSKIIKNKLPGSILNDSGRKGAHVIEEKKMFFVLASTAKMKDLTDGQAPLIQHKEVFLDRVTQFTTCLRLKPGGWTSCSN